MTIADFTGSLCELQAQLDNANETIGKLRAERASMFRLPPGFMPAAAARLPDWHESESAITDISDALDVAGEVNGRTHTQYVRETVAAVDALLLRQAALLTECANNAYELNAAITAADVAEQKQLAAEAEVERLRAELSAERMARLSEVSQWGEEEARLRDQFGQMQTECNKAWRRAEQAEFELALLRGRE